MLGFELTPEHEERLRQVREGNVDHSQGADAELRRAALRHQQPMPHELDHDTPIPSPLSKGKQMSLSDAIDLLTGDDAKQQIEERIQTLSAEQAAETGVSVCVRCAELGEPFRVFKKRELHADHILPVRTHPHLRLARGNIQFLCRRHHSAKTRAENP